jgi:hypothetical protein
MDEGVKEQNKDEEKTAKSVKTQEELDAAMKSYFGKGQKNAYNSMPLIADQLL